MKILEINDSKYGDGKIADVLAPCFPILQSIVNDIFKDNPSVVTIFVKCEEYENGNLTAASYHRPWNDREGN